MSFSAVSMFFVEVPTQRGGLDVRPPDGLCMQATVWRKSVDKTQIISCRKNKNVLKKEGEICNYRIAQSLQFFLQFLKFMQNQIPAFSCTNAYLGVYCKSYAKIIQNIQFTWLLTSKLPQLSSMWSDRHGKKQKWRLQIFCVQFVIFSHFSSWFSHLLSSIHRFWK